MSAVFAISAATPVCLRLRKDRGSAATSLNQSVGSLQSQVNNNLTEARAGTALAFATAGLHYDPRPGKVSVAFGFGNYKGISGLAGCIGWAVTDRFRFNAAFSGAPDTNDFGVAVGG
jgi:trimeric autotransporter adhesin